MDPTKPSKKNLELYQLLCKLLKDEEACADKVRDSESEVRTILKERLEEETKNELEISVYDTDRNERAKKHRKELVWCYPLFYVITPFCVHLYATICDYKHYCVYNIICYSIICCQYSIFISCHMMCYLVLLCATVCFYNTELHIIIAYGSI